MEEAVFNHFMQYRAQVVNTAKNFGRKEKLSPVLMLTISNDVDEQLELAHEMVDVINRANGKNFVTLLR